MALSMRLAQGGAAEPVQMPLRAEILFHSQRLIETLRLEHHADRAPHRGRVARHIVAGDFGAPFARHHHRG